MGCSPRVCHASTRSLRGRGTDTHGDSVRVVALHPVAVIIAKRGLGVVTCRFGRFAADVDFGGLAANERVLDDSVRSTVTDVPKLLPLLENLLTRPYVNCKRNHYNEPAPESVSSKHAREQSCRAIPDRSVEHSYSEEVPLDGYPTPQLSKTIS